MFPKGLTVQYIGTLHKTYAMKFYKFYYILHYSTHFMQYVEK